LFAHKLSRNKTALQPAFFGLGNILLNQPLIRGCDSTAFYPPRSKQIPGCQDIFVKGDAFLVLLAKGFES